jgi:hypothetical protein
MKYYVYTLSYKGEIFYVGKGSKNRMLIHEKRAIKGVKSNNNSALFERINFILSQGDSIEYTKIFETDNECEAYKFEFEVIGKIGLDNLCNLTKDYLKTSVSDMVKVALAKSEKWKEVQMRKKSLEMREYYKMINTGENNPRYGKTNTEEHMIAIKNSLIGVPKSEEHRKKIGDAIRGIVRSDEFKKKLSESLKSSIKFKEVTQSEEFKNKHRQNTKKRHKELITYYFEYNGDIIIHKGGLKDMADEYEISFYYLQKLRYGKIAEYKGWRFISIENRSFKTSVK